LQRIFTEGEQGTLIPVKTGLRLPRRMGFKVPSSIVDLRPTAEALRAAYEAFEQVKNQVYEITRDFGHREGSDQGFRDGHGPADQGAVCIPET